MKLKFAFSAIFLIFTSSAQSAVCLKENQEVNFTGNISRETFPGPPNYESIDDGDKPETYWILTIENPRCVVAESMEDGSSYEVAKSTTRFQLSFEDENIYKTQKAIVETKVLIKGKLFIGISGHHHTKALISVSSISPIKQ